MKTKKDWTGSSSSVWKALGASNHTENEREQDDYYATDPIAIDKLLTVEMPHTVIWKCACGGGHLSQRLKEKGFIVINTDIKDRGNNELYCRADFLAQTDKLFTDGVCYDILTNPPYKYAKEFVLKALDLLHKGGRCYMFLKLAFLEGKARFTELFSKYPPKCVYVFSERIQCAKNGDFESLKKTGGSAVAYAWFVWENGYTGKTYIDWI